MTAIILAVLAIAAIASISLFGGTPEGDPSDTQVVVATGSGTRYILSAEMPSVNDTYPVYRTVTPTVTEDYVKEIAAPFDLTGEVKTLGTGIFEIYDNSKEPDELIEVFKNSGGFRYTVPDNMFPTVDHQPELPTDDEAKAIAEKYCAERGIIPEGECIGGEVSVSYTQGAWDCGKQVSSYDVTLAIRCRQTINGLPTIGGATTVYIGEGGEVVGVTKQSREIEDVPVRYATIITPEQATEELAPGNEGSKPLEEVYDSVTITDISLAYWIEPLVSSQEYVYPVYAFSGTAEEKGETYPVYRYVWAIPSAER